MTFIFCDAGLYIVYLYAETANSLVTGAGVEACRHVRGR